MTVIIFPDPDHPDIPPHVVEVTGTGTLSHRLREYAATLRRSCGPSALSRDLDEAATEIEWLKAKEH